MKSLKKSALTRLSEDRTLACPKLMSLAGLQRANPAVKARPRVTSSHAPAAASRTPAPISHPIVQAKLRIGAPNDKYEQEAERVAGEVMRMAEPPARPDALPVTSLAQRENNSSGSHSDAPPIVSDVLSSPGQQFDSSTRQFLEQRFAHDFSRVRVHADGQAATSAQAVHARAYTVGRDVVFGQGQYVPTTSDGKHLLAHEMAHVLQQQNSAPSIMKFGLGSLGGCVEPVPPERCKHPTGYSIGPGRACMEAIRFGLADSPRTIEGESLDQVFVKELISQTVDYYSFLSWEEMESESANMRVPQVCQTIAICFQLI
jgi:hypothetical protein